METLSTFPISLRFESQLYSELFIFLQLNEERLDYEIHVLRKHEEEVVLVKSEQKRKITNLQVPEVSTSAPGLFSRLTLFMPTLSKVPYIGKSILGGGLCDGVERAPTGLVLAEGFKFVRND